MIRGKVWKFGDNVNTDILAPTTTKTIEDPVARARYCLASVNPEFAKTVQPGDIVVAGKNFGCGSSREGAPKNLIVLGVSCVIAPSFGRIFTRNSINFGLPILECSEAAEAIGDGDELEVDLSSARIANLSRGSQIQGKPFPPFLLSIIEKGGLVNYARAKLQARKGGGG